MNTKLLVIPAIDIQGGKCVRLTKGDFNSSTVYRDNPLEQAILWRKQNAKMIHVVDLDAARAGKPVSFNLIKSITETLDIPVQVGGGIRTVADAEAYLNAGVYRIVLGSVAAVKPELVEELVKEFGSCQVIVGIDAENGVPRINGWCDECATGDVDLGLKMKSLGIERVIYTDISRDGAMQGAGIESTRRFAEQTGLKITASGGVSGYEELMKVDALRPFGVDSVIIGKALYEEAFPCQKIWHDCEGSVLIDTNFSTAVLRPC